MFRSNVTCKTVGGLMYATLSPYASLWSYSMVPCFSLPAPSDLNFGSFFKHNHVSFLFKAVALGSLIELRLISLGIEPSPPPHSYLITRMGYCPMVQEDRPTPFFRGINHGIHPLLGRAIPALRANKH